MHSAPFNMENKEIRTEKDTSDSPVMLKSGYVNVTQEYDIDKSKIRIISDKMENAVSKENSFVGLVTTNNKSSDFDNESKSAMIELTKEMNVKEFDGRVDYLASNIHAKDNTFDRSDRENVEQANNLDFWETNYVAFTCELEDKGKKSVPENEPCSKYK
jgi:hypothetical protein